MEISVSTLVLFAVFSIAVTLAVDFAVLWMMSYGLKDQKENGGGDVDEQNVKS